MISFFIFLYLQIETIQTRNNAYIFKRIAVQTYASHIHVHL